MRTSVLQPCTSLAIVLFASVYVIRAADCNANGVEDDIDVSSGDLEFLVPLSYPLAGFGELTLSDLNGDGRLDLVGSGAGTGCKGIGPAALHVNVALNQGDGAFGAGRSYDLSSMALGLLCGAASGPRQLLDLGGDGPPDLVTLVIGRSGPVPAAVLVSWNDGAGGFPSSEAYVLPESPRAVAAADLDGHGDPDLVVATAFHVEVLLNQGNGTLGAGSSTIIGSGPTALAAADVDLDGDIDMVTANVADSNVSILLGDGTGTLSRPRNYGTGVNPNSILAADLDGDGFPDLATGNSGAQDPDTGIITGAPVSTLRNLVDGRFELAVHYGGDLGIGADSIQAVDINRDGAVDLYCDGFGGALVLGSHAGSFASRLLSGGQQGLHRLLVAELDGTGNLEEVVLAFGTDLGLEGDILAWRDGKTEPDRYRLGAYSLVAGDLDGDGKEELLASARESILCLRKGDDGSFREPRTYPLDTTYPVALASADLNADGRPDLAASSRSALSIVLNSGRGAYSGPRTYPHDWVESQSHIALADMDRDGDLDVVAAGCTEGERNGAGVVLVGFNDGTGALGEIQEHPVVCPLSLLVADLSGDAVPDVATGRVGITVLINAGNGALAAPELYALGGEAQDGLSSLTAADLDGDGRPDLLAGGCLFLNPDSGCDGMALLLGNGDGTFQPAIVHRAGPSAFLQTGDVDGDLDLDVVGLRRGGTWVSLNPGDGRFQAGSSLLYAPPHDVWSLALHDLNGDAWLDLAVGGRDGDGTAAAVWVLLNEGYGVFSGAAQYPIGRSLSLPPDVAAPLSVADFNADGAPDLFSVGSVLLNLGDGAFQEAFSFAMTVLTPSLALDVNADGWLDIVAPNALGVQVILSQAAPPASRDDDWDGVPDECTGTRFHRGDASGDGRLDISDAIALLSFLFLGAAPPACREAGDSQNDGAIDVSDAIAILSFLFLGSPPPPAPGPPGLPCGLDPDPPGSAAHLDCSSYPVCE